MKWPCGPCDRLQKRVFPLFENPKILREERLKPETGDFSLTYLAGLLEHGSAHEIFDFVSATVVLAHATSKNDMCDQAVFDGRMSEIKVSPFAK